MPSAFEIDTVLAKLAALSTVIAEEVLVAGVVDRKMTLLNLMDYTNKTSAVKFLIMGFSSSPKLQALFFAAFLLIYLLAVLGNLLIMIVIYSETHLHTPMYFFLVNLALLDICFTSSVIPNMMVILLSETKSMSYWGCMAQMFLLSAALGTELLLVTVMAFDRYVAICKPLHYPIIMRKTVYLSLAAAVWILGILNSMLHVGLILKLSFLEQNVVDHIFCEIPAVSKVAISNTYAIDHVTMVADIFLCIICFTLIIITYSYILSSILKMHSAEKMKKAFSTCASHLLVVGLLYGTTSYTYLLPAMGFGGKKDKVVSALYAAGCPVFNPMIYSLRNQDVKQAFLKICSSYFTSFRNKTAFDTISHHNHINRLNINIKENAFFLTDAHRLSSSFTSEPKNIIYGVPQKSSLSSTLFNTDMTPLTHIVRSHGSNIICYVDDTQLILLLTSDPPPSEQTPATP
ncbi:olfactory receptor 13G1-like [Pleurodeles waltl]|uniref:olfactory receptor 13G1-like n=1 Tax=Pleurodeles waltl TaxID=8319 RepID=UPI003709512A